MLNTPVDAIPDLSDVQVIVFGPSIRARDPRSSKTRSPTRSLRRCCRCRSPERSGPRLLVLRHVVRLHHLRGRHRYLLGAKSRVLEYLNLCFRPVARRRKAGTWGRMQRASDGSIEYALVDTTGKHDLAELRAHPGLAPCATSCRASTEWLRWPPCWRPRASNNTRSSLDPKKLSGYGIPWLAGTARLAALATATSAARLVEIAESEFIVRGRGYLEGLEDLRDVRLKTPSNGAHGDPDPRTWQTCNSARTSGEALLT